MDNFNLRKYLVENKVTTNSKMLKENEDDIFRELAREDANSFQDLVAAHGFDAVVKALAELYSDAYYNMYDSLKHDSGELEDMLGALDGMSETKGLKEDVEAKDLKFKEGVLGFVYDFEDGVLAVLREPVSKGVVELLNSVLRTYDVRLFNNIDDVDDFLEDWDKESVKQEFGEVLDIL